jgi:hypothetical protein
VDFAKPHYAAIWAAPCQKGAALKGKTYGARQEKQWLNIITKSYNGHNKKIVP